MSATCSLRCALLASRAARVAPATRRLLSSSSKRKDDRVQPSKRRAPTDPTAASDAKVHRDLEPYTPSEHDALKNKYTPEQMATIELGEQAVDATDVWEQGALRNDPMALEYFEDFSTTRPYIDYKNTNHDQRVNPRSAKRSEADLSDLTMDADSFAIQDVASLRRLVSSADSVVEHALPKFTDPLMRRTARASRTDSSSDQAQFLAQLSKQTGLEITKLRQLRVKRLVQHRVSNQTRMGKISKQYVLMIAGDRKGLLGIGEGSAVEAEQAVAKARRNAIRSMVPIPRYENRTIFGDVKGKVGATELELYTRPPGFGLRCQEKILEMCKCAGIADLSARVTRARNPMNTVKATFEALLSQRDPEQVARARGRKMVDVRKVYYAGQV